MKNIRVVKSWLIWNQGIPWFQMQPIYDWHWPGRLKPSRPTESTWLSPARGCLGPGPANVGLGPNGQCRRGPAKSEQLESQYQPCGVSSAPGRGPYGARLSQASVSATPAPWPSHTVQGGRRPVQERCRASRLGESTRLAPARPVESEQGRRWPGGSGPAVSTTRPGQGPTEAGSTLESGRVSTRMALDGATEAWKARPRLGWS